LDVAKEIAYRPRFDLLLGADQLVKAPKWRKTSTLKICIYQAVDAMSPV
jgi:hypothetical protein